MTCPPCRCQLLTTLSRTIALAAVLLPAVRGQWGILQNGGFETTTSSFAPWQCTASDCGVDAAGDGHFPAQGNNNAYFFPGEALYQVVNVTPGATYTLGFNAYLDQSPAARQLQVGLDPQGVMTWGDPDGLQVTVPNGTDDSGPYAWYSLNLTASDASAFLSFTYDPSAYTNSAVRFDNCSMTLAALPANSSSSDSPAPQPSGGGGGGASTGAVAGAAVGCAVAGALLAAGAFLVWRKLKSGSGKANYGGEGGLTRPSLTSPSAKSSAPAMSEVPAPYYPAPSSSGGTHLDPYPGTPGGTTRGPFSQGQNGAPPMPMYPGQGSNAPPPPEVQEDLRLYARSPDVYPAYSR